jgi:hypothetical protein
MKKAPPRVHPAPHGSLLWPHLEVIREARRRKHTWNAITQQLNRTCGIKLTAGTVRNFFKRASRHQRAGLGQVVRLKPAAPLPPMMLIDKSFPAYSEPESDPFSVNIVNFDPWQPAQTNKRAS